MRVHVENFQSLGDVDIEVEGLTVLVGPSNRGKSALVRAIEAALFNKPGDDFIRVGKKTATVEIAGLPGVGLVQWTKSGGKTTYQINGQSFGKLAGGTPPALMEGGYRDVWIGDKERKRGEYLRPQVSKQWGGVPFLLDRSGAFISDVLGAISRHAVLLTAQGRAAGDQRTAKQRLGLRETDLTAATQQLEVLTDAPALAERVAALKAAYEAHGALAAVVARCRALLAARARYVPLAASVLPAATVIPEHLGYREYAARPRVVVRTRLVSLPTLPPSTAVPLDLDTRLAKARGLVGRRRPLAALVAATLPGWVRLPAFEPWLTQRDGLSRMLSDRARTLDMLHRCEVASRASTTEAEIVEAELATFLAGLAICPICERPMES